jgi:SOS-response transcriptional repressor LexA
MDKFTPTPHQLMALVFIADHIAEKKYAPTLREIAADAGVTFHRAQELVQSLVRRGCIRLNGERKSCRRVALTHWGEFQVFGEIRSAKGSAA